MFTPSPRTPAECAAAILWWLSQAVVTRGITGQLSQALVTLIIDRIRGIKQRFARLADRIRAGTYRPRRPSASRRIAAGRPRPQNPLPQHFGWLQSLLPEAPQFRAQLEHLFRDPDMLALMQAAPAEMARVLRPLCWMLRVTPPPVLARPRPAAAPASTEARPSAGPPPPPSGPPPSRSPPATRAPARVHIPTRSPRPPILA